MSSPQAPEQPKSIPHHEWDRLDQPDPEQPSEIDYATDAYEAARRIIDEAKPAAPQSDADAEFDRLDRQGGHFRAKDIRHKAGIPEDPKN